MFFGAAPTRNPLGAGFVAGPPAEDAEARLMESLELEIDEMSVRECGGLVDPVDAPKRKYRRLETNFIAKIRGRKPTPATMRQLRSRVTNLSQGGAFIETVTPFPMGEIVEIDFSLPGRGPVHAKGLVRWSSKEGAQPGMGVEFLEVSIPEKEAIQTYVETRVAEEGFTALTKTPLHQDLLQLWSRKVGEIFSIAIVRSYLGCEPMQAIDLVEEFAKEEILKLDGDMVRFLPCHEPGLAASIRKHLGVRDEEEAPPLMAKVRGGTRRVRST